MNKLSTAGLLASAILLVGCPEDALVSPGFACANLMNEQMTEMGAGMAVSAGGAVYWSQIVGSP